MAEDTVKFCARVGPRSVSLVITNCDPNGRGQGHVMSYSFRKISVNISKTAQDRSRYTCNGSLIGNRIWHIKWQQR